MIVIDTDVLIEIFDRGSREGEEALNRIIKTGEEIGITAVNLHEILYGLQKYAKPVKEVLRLPVLSYTKEDARLAAEIELRMEGKGLPIRRTDAMIAATAMNNGAGLYTFDTRHFEPLRSLGLKLFK